MICSDICHKYHGRSIFQNCLKFHSPNGSWNYVQFWNITRGIYAKYHYKSFYYLYLSSPSSSSLLLLLLLLLSLLLLLLLLLFTQSFHSVFVMTKIIKVSVMWSASSFGPWLITHISTLIILGITKPTCNKVNYRSVNYMILLGQNYIIVKSLLMLRRCFLFYCP